MHTQSGTQGADACLVRDVHQVRSYGATEAPVVREKHVFVYFEVFRLACFDENVCAMHESGVGGDSGDDENSGTQENGKRVCGGDDNGCGDGMAMMDRAVTVVLMMMRAR
jgi:hypothetical protein